MYEPWRFSPYWERNGECSAVVPSCWQRSWSDGTSTTDEPLFDLLRAIILCASNL